MDPSRNLLVGAAAALLSFGTFINQPFIWLALLIMICGVAGTAVYIAVQSVQTPDLSKRKAA